MAFFCMMLLLLLLLLCVGGARAATEVHFDLGLPDEMLFSRFVPHFGRVYGSEDEWALRRVTFNVCC